jgi:hypothetical protein
MAWDGQVSLRLESEASHFGGRQIRGWIEYRAETSGAAGGIKAANGRLVPARRAWTTALEAGTFSSWSGRGRDFFSDDGDDEILQSDDERGIKQAPLGRHQASERKKDQSA